MTEPNYQPNEILDITIRNARVIEGDGGRLVYEYSTIGRDDPTYARAAIQPWADSVTITRVMPAAGEPRLGDLWKDVRGVLWLAVQRTGGVQLHDGGTGGPWPITQVQGTYGPLALVYRDPVDGGETGE
ncbi:hypothetical protein Ssi03_62070 [Sphaerisporangium siamense]|uniref:Uncharacterized protein n=1 Tax=Sphaerisporangium siamense TaxID=795645 RepID=A0A7W7G971_9ACTN|nr:hypothetical protein [Sphaerisporangium siamense]MBB4702518.1 hypothetical protein [Sphaerisporangium siamense]GII88217.1 hypothetical protein Ssi03_62070 [Sphaerisporangium siamense]